MPPTPDATTLVQIDQTQVLDWAWDRLSASPDARIKVARGYEFPQPDPQTDQIAGVWLEGLSVTQSTPSRGQETGTFLLHVTTFSGSGTTHPWAMGFLSSWLVRRLFQKAQCADEAGLSVTPMSYQSGPTQTFGDAPGLRAQQHTIMLNVRGAASAGAGFFDTLTA